MIGLARLPADDLPVERSLVWVVQSGFFQERSGSSSLVKGIVAVGNSYKQGKNKKGGQQLSFEKKESVFSRRVSRLEEQFMTSQKACKEAVSLTIDWLNQRRQQRVNDAHDKNWKVSLGL